MKQTIINVIHPFRRPLYFIPHLTLLAAIVIAFLLGFGSGFVAGTKFDALYYRQHNHTFLPVVSQAATKGHVAGAGRVPEYHWLPRQFVRIGLNQGNTNACGSVSNAEDASFVFNKNNGTSRLFSYRWLYWWAAGPRNIPTALEQYNPIIATYGVVRNRYWGWTGMGDPNDLTAPSASVRAQAQRLDLAPKWLYTSDAPGMGGVERIDAEIAADRMPMVGMDVTSALYDAATTGEYDPTGPLTFIGGHIMAAVAYDNHHVFRTGAVGGVLFAQSWGKDFGVGWNGARQDGANNGLVWVSSRYLAAHSWGAMAQHQAKTAGHLAGMHYVAPHTTPVPPPPAPKHVGGIAGSGTPQVYNVRTADTGVDISADINSAARTYGFSAPGFAALMGVESGIKQYAPHYPINGAGYCDYSAGLVQITVCTAAGYPLYIGNGTLYASNIQFVFNYLQADPHRAVWAAARLLSDFKAKVCWDFPPLYASWNMGPGYGCYNTVYEYPNNWITQQAVASFRGWWNWVWAYHVTYAQTLPKVEPKPRLIAKPFPKKSWGAKPYRQHGKLTWAATHYVKRLGHYRGESYHQPNWRGRYMKYTFRKGVMYCWYGSGQCKLTFRHRGGLGMTKAAQSCATTGTQCRQYLVQLMNEQRAQYGVAALSLSQLQSNGNVACQGSTGHAKAEATSGTIWHVNPDYPTQSFPNNLCLPFHAAGENTGMASGSKYEAVTSTFGQMMAEPHSYGCTGNHACNIISPQFSQVGVGFATNGQWRFDTEDFVGN